MSTAIPRPGLADWFKQIIDGLCPFIAAHAGVNRRDAPLVMVLWPYLRRLARRFAALVARGGAPARGRRPGSRPSSGTPPSPRLALPHGMAWLLPIVPLVGNFGGLLHVLLASEEFAALLAAGPQAGRLMRPLCRMLNVGPEHLDLPRALFQPPPRPVKPRPRPAAAPAAISQAAISQAAISQAAISQAAISQAAHSPAAAASPGCSLPSDGPQAGAPISDPPPGFPPKSA